MKAFRLLLKPSLATFSSHSIHGEPKPPQAPGKQLLGVQHPEQVSCPQYGSVEITRHELLSLEPLNARCKHSQHYNNYEKDPSLNHNQQKPKQQCEVFRRSPLEESSISSKWAHIVAHVSDPSRVLGRECRNAGQVPPCEPCHAPSTLEALISADKAEDSRGSRSCVASSMHTTSLAVVLANTKASSPPLQNEDCSSLKTPVLDFCSTTSVTAHDSLDNTCPSLDALTLQMEEPLKNTSSSSTTTLEDICAPDKPIKSLTDFQMMVTNQMHSLVTQSLILEIQDSLLMVSLKANEDLVFSWTKLDVTNDVNKSSTQAVDMILMLSVKMRQVANAVNIHFGICKIVIVNNSAMIWDLATRALDAEALQSFPFFNNYPWILF